MNKALVRIAFSTGGSTSLAVMTAIAISLVPGGLEPGPTGQAQVVRMALAAFVVGLGIAAAASSVQRAIACQLLAAAALAMSTPVLLVMQTRFAPVLELLAGQTVPMPSPGHLGWASASALVGLACLYVATTLTRETRRR